MSYSMCATAVSSVSSAASPWALAQSATITVSAFPTYSATTQQYAFPVQAVQAGSYTQVVQGANQSASTSAATSFASTPQLYLSSLGTWSLDTSGLSLHVSSAIRLPSSSSSAQATASITLQGAIASPAVSPSASPLLFAQPLATVPWSPRLISGLAFLNRPASFTSLSGTSILASPPLALILYGGQANTTTLYNDIYVSSDAGVTFQQVQPSSVQAFTPLDGAIKMRDSTGRLYLLGGSYTSTVQYSDNGLTWSTATAPWHGRAYTGAVADPFGRIFVFGGQGAVDDHTGASGTYLNDVWMSTTQGVSWTLQTLAAAWDIRDSLMGVAYYSQPLQRTILLNSGGHDDTTLNFRPNEVWASSDLGVTWSLFLVLRTLDATTPR